MNAEQKLYYQMLKIRKFEQKVVRLYADGELPGFVHLPTRQWIAYRQIVQRHQAVIGPGRYRQRGAMLEHIIDEIEMRSAVIKTGVDVRETDVDQCLGLIYMRGSDDGFHGELHGLAQLAIESILIKRV